MYKSLLQIKAYSSRASLSHAIPVKKNIENDFSMEFSASSKSREIDRSEGFYRIMSLRRDIAPISLGLSRGLSNVLVLRKPIRWREIIYPVLVVARTDYLACFISAYLFFDTIALFV